MANTGGGYIAVGFNETPQARFDLVGTAASTQSILRQENLQTWVQQFTDVAIKIQIQLHNLKSSCTVGLICVHPSRTPVVFTRDGQYQDPKTKRSVTRFSQGELFVRHGTKSERGTSEDWSRMVTRVRADERQKVLVGASGQLEVTQRLDTIIGLLGGPSGGQTNVDLVQGGAGDVSDRIASLLALDNDVLLRRSLKKEFVRLQSACTSCLATSDPSEAADQMERDFLYRLRRLLFAWSTSIEYDHFPLARLLADGVHGLYVAIGSAEVYGATRGLRLSALASTVYIAYAFGALAVASQMPKWASLLIDDRNTSFDRSNSVVSWFRYMVTMLARANMLKNKSLLALAIDFASSDDETGALLGDTDNLWSSVCQFDFLQCFHVAGGFSNTAGWFPNYAVFYKHRVEPIIEKIVLTHDEGIWAPAMPAVECRRLLDQLDKGGAERFGFEHDWDYGKWSSSTVSQFMANDTTE
jgi:hypothetical protein